MLQLSPEAPFNFSSNPIIISNSTLVRGTGVGRENRDVTAFAEKTI